jgi:hypothetical protein
MVQAVTPGGRIVLVMGPRTISGVRVDTAQVFADFLARDGATRSERKWRNISGKRLPIRAAHRQGKVGDTINTESIDVFEVAGVSRARHEQVV